MMTPFRRVWGKILQVRGRDSLGSGNAVPGLPNPLHKRSKPARAPLRLAGVMGLVGCCFSPWFSPIALAAPESVAYVGELQSPNGTPLTATVSVSAALYGSASGNDILWGPHSLGNVTVVAGVFQVILGGADTAPLDDILYDQTAMWLEFTIDSEVLSPRQALHSVPFARIAADSERLGGLEASLYLVQGPQDFMGSISVGGVAVIDESGQWVGSPTGLQGPPGAAGPAGPMGPAGTSLWIDGSGSVTTTANVGVKTANPAVALDVSGAVRLGSATTCDAATEGSLRYNATNKMVEFCNGTGWGSLSAVPNPGPSSGPGSATTPGTSCKQIFADGGSIGNGMYWLDSNGDDPGDKYLAYCDMLADGGGWTKIESAHWPFFFSAANWSYLNDNFPNSEQYSIASRLSHFADGLGCYEMRLQAGHSGNWTQAPTHVVRWKQCHNPFTATTNGSDYTFLGGTAPTTCGGFNGLHNKYQGYSYTTDVDSVDATGCWWMQIVPSVQYPGYNGYLDGWGGTLNSHVWQSFWVR